MQHTIIKGKKRLQDLPPILVVDSQPDFRTELEQSLNRVGFPVESASDGSEALDMFKAVKYSMVIADEQSSGADGLNVLNSVKKISPQIPVVIMTDRGTVLNAVEAMQAGACDYILKPFSFEVLEKTIKKAIGALSVDTAITPGAGAVQNRKTDKEIITRNPTLKGLLKQARDIAPSNATVLIQGESGTGKELLAAYVHRHSLHPEAPYVAINCAALPDTLAESELFGHEKGSFTGAVGRKVGKFELVKKGTLVLDEISEMALPLQAKLLRVLQEKEIDRVGGTHPIPINARVVAISNVDLKQAVKAGKFREDLYYRINVIPLTLPALRQRKEDIELLARYFMEKYCRLNQKKIIEIDQAALDVLQNHKWVGNVRELENTIERAVLVGNGPCISPQNFLLEASENRAESSDTFRIKAGRTVRDMEKELIFQTLQNVNDNRTQAAELLGISIRTLRNKLREYKEETAS
jgi:DNA-binding NtrC family response regulator